MGKNLLRDNMTEKSEPLYCWKVSTDTGEITKYKITHYSKRKIGSYVFEPESKSAKFDYRFFDDKNQLKSTNTDKLDRFVSNQLYSFTDDDERAFKIISESISERIQEHQKLVENNASLLLKFNGGKLRYEENGTTTSI
jgi:hypothetical protein